MAEIETQEAMEPPVVPADDAPRLAFVPNKDWQRERIVFYRMLPELLKTHRGRYVAVLGGAIVGTGDDFITVAQDAYSRHGHIPIYIGLVSETPARLIRVPSPRAASAGALRHE